MMQTDTDRVDDLISCHGVCVYIYFTEGFLVCLLQHISEAGNKRKLELFFCLAFSTSSAVIGQSCPSSQLLKAEETSCAAEMDSMDAKTDRLFVCFGFLSPAGHSLKQLSAPKCSDCGCNKAFSLKCRRVCLPLWWPPEPRSRQMLPCYKCSEEFADGAEQSCASVSFFY